MRPTAPAEAPRHDSNEIAADLEARFSYDREGFASTLAYIGAFGAALASEYLDRWRVSAARDSIRGDLTDFERWRFGAELYPAAHALLLFHVLHRAYPDDRRITRSRLGKPQELTAAWTPGEYEGRAPRVPLAGVAGDMPHGLGRKGHENRINELKAQAHEALNEQGGA